MFTTTSIRAQTNFTILYSFSGTNGANPSGRLIQGQDGNFYGTTYSGGEFGYGTVFCFTPTGGVRTLFSFNETNGAYALAPVIQGSDGNLYGTTRQGGTSEAGTVFSLTTNGTLNYSISFAGTNGENIQAGLVQGSDGNFYGVAIDGGEMTVRPNGGTIFRLTTNGVLSTLLFFGQSDDYAQDGINPNGSLLQGPDGNFYGATAGGLGNDGVIYKATTEGTVSPLFDFDGADGSAPTGPLVLGPNGNFFGFTQDGGAYGWGTLFEISSNGIFTNLFSFDGTNGLVACGPGPSQLIQGGLVLYSVVGGLVLGSDGNFYGETVCGGRDFFPGNGTLFQFTPGGNLTTLYTFGSGGADDGLGPAGGLIQAADGNFYGVTFYGGTNGEGTIFRLSLPLPPSFQSFTNSGGSYSLTWSAVAGRTYQLQYTTNLISSNWINLGVANTATNGSMIEWDHNSTDTQRFYRVLLWQ